MLGQDCGATYLRELLFFHMFLLISVQRELTHAEKYIYVN